jgi:DNA-binding HxlR family transcriptional regulator
LLEIVKCYVGGVRTYGQYCALARGLDVVGDRWALLIVRELLEGPRRYNELLDGLPGVATNLLAERLRALEGSGVVLREPDKRYALTPWGAGLRDVVYEVARWAAPLMARPAGDDEFRPHWLRHVVAALYDGADDRRGDFAVEIRSGGDPVTLTGTAGRVTLARGPVASPDLVLEGPPDGVVGLLAGKLARGTAEALGVAITGDLRTLRRLRPRTSTGG